MISGIILAGGRSTRMEKEKGLNHFRGKPLILHVIENIRPVCDEILICTNNHEYDSLGYKVIPDEIQGAGPAGGILSGLKRSKNSHCLILSCDLPFASARFIQKIDFHSPEKEITVCFHDDRLQPLCGFYDSSITENFGQKVRSGMYKMQELVKSFDFQAIHQIDMIEFPFEYYLKNFNSKHDIIKIERTKVFILTGPKNGGKTTFLGKIIDILDKTGKKYTGIGTRAILENNIKTGFNLIDLKSRTEHLLCTVKDVPGWMKSGKFYFDPAVLKEGNDIISPGKAINIDLVIIDEFGPLEITGGGWRNGIDKLLRKSDQKLLIVIRDEILTEAYQAFKDHSCQILNIKDLVSPESACSYILESSDQGN